MYQKAAKLSRDTIGCFTGARPVRVYVSAGVLPPSIANFPKCE
jgi:hypothetical protein